MATNADGSIIIKTSVDVDQAEKDLAKLKGSIAKTEAEIENLKGEKMPLVKRLEELGLEADEAAKKLDMMKNALPGTYSDLQIKEQTETVRHLGSQFDSVSKRILNYDKNIDRATQKLHAQQEEAGDLSKKINSVSKAPLKMAEAQKKAEKNAQRFSMRLKAVVRSALVFTLIT